MALVPGVWLRKVVQCQGFHAQFFCFFKDLSLYYNCFEMLPAVRVAAKSGFQGLLVDQKRVCQDKTCGCVTCGASGDDS